MTPFEAVFGQKANDNMCVGSQETDEFINEEKVEYMFESVSVSVCESVSVSVCESVSVSVCESVSVSVCESVSVSVCESVSVSVGESVSVSVCESVPLSVRTQRAEKPGSGWLEFLYEIQYSFNKQCHSSIKMTPFEAVFGQKANDNMCVGSREKASKIHDGDWSYFTLSIENV
jgi:hypothetical protein